MSKSTVIQPMNRLISLQLSDSVYKMSTQISHTQTIIEVTTCPDILRGRRGMSNTSVL